MATSVSDIDAKIAELQKQKKKMLEAEKAAKKKEAEARQKKIGALVEKVLGEITDMDDFKSKLESLKKDENVSASLNGDALSSQVSLN